MVLGELGWWKLKARRDMIRLRYWRGLIKMQDDKLPKRVYEWELRRRKGKRSWIIYTRVWEHRKRVHRMGLRDGYVQEQPTAVCELLQEER